MNTRTAKPTALARLLLATCAVAFGVGSALSQTAPVTPASQPAPSREESLWREIQTLTRTEEQAGDYRERSAMSAKRKATLLERVRGYLAIYPGGAHRDEAVRLELRTLFDIGTLTGGRYDDLCSRVKERLQHPLCESARQEAEYWAVFCNHLRTAASGGAPTSAPVASGDERLMAAYGELAERYPRARLAPHLLGTMFDAAERRGDLGDMRRIAARLTENFPQHPVAESVAARLRRAAAIGKPFHVEFDAADGSHVDTRKMSGHPLLIVVWAGFDHDSRVCAAAVEAARRDQPELRVVGVNLDSSAGTMQPVCDELGAPWPQLNDGRGWAGEFVTKWGIRAIPSVFAVGSDGRLIGVGEGDGWRRTLQTVLGN